MRELVYYVAVSLDGYIASPNGSFDAFPVEGDHMTAIVQRYGDALPTVVADGLGVAQERDRFSTVLMGWNTYAVGLPHGMTSPYSHLEQVVFSQSHHGADAAITTTADDPATVVRRLKQQPGTGIWLCGGGNLAAQLIDEIDRLIIKRNPVLLGAGIPLFSPGSYAPRPFALVESTSFSSGVTIEEYEAATP